MTNGEACSQQATDDIIADDNLSDTFVYVDSLMVCGGTQDLAKFLTVAEKYNSTLNCGKCAFSAKTIDLQGYTIADETTRPDLGRSRPLRELSPPQVLPSLRRAIETFGYDAKRTPDYSEKIHSLEQSKDFPLGDAMVPVFAGLNNDIGNSVVLTIGNSLPLGEDADASDCAIAATLQSGRGQRHSSVGKAAYAIVEVSREWRPYLLGKLFTIIAD